MEGAGGTAGRKRTWLRCPWAVAWPGQTIHSTKASPVRRAPEGPEGMGGLRGAVPNEVRSPSLAGGRGLRRPEHPWSHKQPGPVTVSGPPPTGAPRSPAQQAPGTSAEPQQHGNRHHTNAPRHTKNRHPLSGCRSVVELGGFEPPTFSLRTRRATNCAIAPRTRTA